MKKVVTMLLGVILTVGLLFGCASDDSGSKTVSANESSQPIDVLEERIAELEKESEKLANDLTEVQEKIKDAPEADKEALDKEFTEYYEQKKKNGEDLQKIQSEIDRIVREAQESKE